MTVGNLKTWLAKYGDDTPVKLTFFHQKSKVIVGAFEVFETDKMLVYDAVVMDGCVVIHGSDET